MKGATLGAATVVGAPAQVARYMFRLYGIKPDVDVQFVAVGFGARGKFYLVRQNAPHALLLAYMPSLGPISRMFQTPREMLSPAADGARVDVA